MNNTNKFKAFRAYQESQHSAPLPPNKLLRPIHFIEVRVGEIWVRVGRGSPEFLRTCLDAWRTKSYVKATRLVSRLSDGRKLVLPQ